MADRSNLKYILNIIGIILAPTVLSLAYYSLSKNPNLRPLAVTQRSLQTYEAGRGDVTHIVARVDWVEGNTHGYSRDQLYDLLTGAFAVKGVEVDLVFFPSEGRTEITYIVGRSWMGPYTLTNAAEGISAAVMAYKESNPTM